MMLILQSSVLSNMEGEIPAAVDFREEYCAGQAFYAIPGSGRDVPVKAGESLIIVNNAQNHLESNPDSWDATTADFEWYDESSNENFLDTDNPAVPNLDKWYAQTLTVHSLHNRGAYGIAIAMPPAGTTGEQFLQDHPIGDGYYYIFHSPNGSDYEMPIKGYFVPNEWVLDAVNTGWTQHLRHGSLGHIARCGLHLVRHGGFGPRPVQQVGDPQDRFRRQTRRYEQLVERLHAEHDTFAAGEIEAPGTPRDPSGPPARIRRKETANRSARSVCFFKIKELPLYA